MKTGDRGVEVFSEFARDWNRLTEAVRDTCAIGDGWDKHGGRLDQNVIAPLAAAGFPIIDELKGRTA
jgi:hypothetical protein